MLTQLNVNEDVICNSQDAYVGEIQDTGVKFVTKFQDFYQYHPYVTSGARRGRPESLQLAHAIISKAVSSMAGVNAQTGIESENEYMYLFNAVCIDIAREEHQLSEPDFLHLLSEYELTTDSSIQKLYKEVTTKVIALCNGAEEVDEEEQKREQERERQEAQARELER